MDVWALSAMKTCYTIYRFLQTCLMPTAAASTRHRLLSSRNLAEYQALARQVDTEDGLVAWREDDETDLPQAEMLKSTIAKLDESMRARDANKLQFMLLNGLLKRNHLGIDERALHLRALSGTKLLVEQYDKKVVECIQFLCDCHELTREEKTIFFKKARRALGQTALLLSGGGSIAMYHAGVVRALITEGLYKHVRVISGASGGSIIAGQLAMHSEKELMEKVLVKEVSTDFKGTGEMKRRNIVWFPPLIAQAKHFLRNGVLIDNKEFQKTCEFYYGDTTFQGRYCVSFLSGGVLPSFFFNSPTSPPHHAPIAEGFERTRKHVCISVAASTLGSANPGGPRRLLLNHVTTPNVLIRSAVAASCSLPGIMLPNFLLCKNETGQIVPFEMDGVQYVDGSLQADLPFRRISTLFAVSHFIVSQVRGCCLSSPECQRRNLLTLPSPLLLNQQQVNFHIVPFIHKAHSPSENSLYWKLFRFFDTDIRHRVTSLAELGLLPRVFGQDLSGIFKQKYSGHVTLTPKFRMSEMVGLKAFQNPTESEMQHYILNGKRSVWPHIHHIKHNTLVERTLAEGLAKLRRQSYLSAMGQPGTGSVTSSPSRPLPTPLQYAVPSGMATNGGTGTHANGASSPSATPTTTPRGLHSSLPPLAPTNGSSAASSRSSTPRRVVREDISMPPPLSLATLRRSDSGRFEDDDGDMLGTLWVA